jgi:hypothetical protein
VLQELRDQQKIDGEAREGGSRATETTIEGGSKTTKTDAEELCVYCLEHSIRYAFIPCGHFSCCEICANEIMATSKLCPSCTGPCSDTLKIYKSSI